MLNTAHVTTPTKLLATYLPFLESRAMSRTAPVLGAEHEIAKLRDELIALSLQKIASADYYDALSLSELGFLQPISLSVPTLKKLDRLLPKAADKAHFSFQMSLTLHEYHWRAELRLSTGFYFKGLKRRPRHVLSVYQMTETDVARIAEVKKRSDFPRYGHAARLQDSLKAAGEFFDGDGREFVERRLRELGSLFDIDVEDDVRLIAWAEGIRAIQRDYQRLGFQQL